MVVCTPATLKLHPVEQPEDLPSMAFAAPTALDEEEACWQFHRGNETRTIALRTVMIMNIALGAREAVKAGGCFTIMPDFLLTEAFNTGHLVSLLPDWSLREGGVYGLCPNTARSSAQQCRADFS